MSLALPFLPTKEEVIAAAKEAGWDHSIVRGLDVLSKINSEILVVL